MKRRTELTTAAAGAQAYPLLTYVLIIGQSYKISDPLS